MPPLSENFHATSLNEVQFVVENETYCSANAGRIPTSPPATPTRVDSSTNASRMLGRG
ncbi:MAG TPA: hypothetical protein VE404_01870 [Verrucomicrobiae bacterium]|nr:hypothetical protein [Verrucomicrobiae bacterium]